ncbi:MAG TPA: hypothetical protein VFN21_08080 [Acidimicrobiales bacterium]|nr:hypothetical protein [Acidimicrobiales bacterium]
MTRSGPVRFAVVGADHLHLFSIVDGLIGAGAVAAAHVPAGTFIGAYAGWQSASEPIELADLLADPSIDLVVTVGVPADRAAVAVAALGAGKSVVSAKPGMTSPAQLDAIRAATRDRPGRPYTVLFTERFENRAVVRAIELARGGAIGTVTRVRGVGPHTLDAPSRPAWFFDPERSGGIIVDLASHQIDEFLTITGDPVDAVIVDAAAGNVASPDHPDFEDVGSLSIIGGGVEGHHGVDLLSPAGLGTWGDVRLEVTGTAGTLEVRANIDVCGEPGPEHLFHVDAEGSRRVDVSGVDIGWATTLLADLVDDSESLMSQQHVFAVSELSLAARSQARTWGSAR